MIYYIKIFVDYEVDFIEAHIRIDDPSDIHDEIGDWIEGDFVTLCDHRDDTVIYIPMSEVKQIIAVPIEDEEDAPKARQKQSRYFK